MESARHTLRGLIRSPRWSALVILARAVGIGATIAVFGVVDALLIKPERRLVESAEHPRFLTGLASAFAAIAVMLGGIGVYGTVAYWVARRRRDLGIRVALGASREAVLRLVLARGIRLALCTRGGIVGMVASLAATRTISATLLFETSPRDPSVLIAAATALMVLALIACMLPALHAAQLDQAKVLRAE